MKARLGPITSVVAVFVLLLAVNVVGSIGLRDLKLDLTEEHLYTLADGSKGLLEKLEDEVKLKLFYSKKAAADVPRLRQYADRVMELLRQYEAAGGGKIVVEELEPRPDTEIEEWAVQYGLRPMKRLGGESLYLGLVAVSETGQEELIPFLSPQRESFLEYDITRMISSVGQSERKTIGILSSFDVIGNADDPMARFGRVPLVRPWAFVTELRKQYEVQKVDSDAQTIDDAIDLLIVIHPKGLPDATRYAIDQYVLRGGSTMIAVDPLSMYEQTTFQSPDPNARFQASFDSNLSDLLKAWGVEVAPGQVAADPDLATQIRMGRQVFKHPTFLTVGPGECNQEEIVSAELESLLFAHAGFLREVEGETGGDLTRTPLVQTGPRGGEVDGMLLKFGGDPEQLRRDLKPGEEPLTLVMKLSGTFPTAFPEGKPKAEEEEGESEVANEPGHLGESSEDATVIVVADTDILSDDFSVRKQDFFGQTLIMLINDNLSFLGNAAEVLLGGQELATLRTRGKSDRPFTLVDRLEREADERWKGVEEGLLKKQQETNQRLAELERGKDEANRTVLSASQLEEIQKFRSELAATKKELREVRRNLRQDIESLGSRLKFLHIGVMPALVLLAGFIPVIWRHTRNRG